VYLALPRHAGIWLPDYILSRIRACREQRRRRGLVHILLAVADHYEPLHGEASFEAGLQRVERWLERYPALASGFTDSDGRHPQHTFFFPIEQYRPEFLDRLAGLCRAGFGEVEVHVHHDDDTADSLRRQLAGFTRTLHERHGLLARDASGRIAYAFIHGNWALDNSMPDGRWCGVSGELAVLRDTGCYADFTLPSVPSPAQTHTVNRIYYTRATAPGPRAHDRGVRAAVGRTPGPDDFLLVQGPLALSWTGAKWGVVPRVENGSLHAGHPPTVRRLANWASCGISVAGRPDWLFVKVYTHGAPERNADMLLGPGMAAFHRGAQAEFDDGKRFRLHYVTAREMANIIHAAEDGRTGDPGQYRDYVLAPPPIAGNRATGPRGPERGPVAGI
jgi:hypothetical protein